MREQLEYIIIKASEANVRSGYTEYFIGEAIQDTRFTIRTPRYIGLTSEHRLCAALEMLYEKAGDKKHGRELPRKIKSRNKKRWPVAYR